MDSPSILIIDTEPKHLREMAEKMHIDTAETALKLGISPQKALWRSYKQSIVCKAAFIDGKIAAIWGISGQLFGEVGYPWLILSPQADDYPFKVAFIYRQELKKMQTMFPILQDYVDETHDKAVRMLELMGFKIGNEVIVRGEVKLRHAERRA